MTNTNINEGNRLFGSHIAVYAAPVDEIILEYEVAKEEWLNIAAAVQVWSRRHAGFLWDSLGGRNSKGTYPLRIGLTPNLSQEALGDLKGTLEPLLATTVSQPVHTEPKVLS